MSSSLGDKKDIDLARKIVDHIFVQFDVDSNGGLTKLEFPAALNSILSQLGKQVICNEDIIEIFQLLDVNGDQTISKQQLLELILKLQELIEQYVRIHGVRVRKDSD